MSEIEKMIRFKDQLVEAKETLVELCNSLSKADTLTTEHLAKCVEANDVLVKLLPAGVKPLIELEELDRVDGKRQVRIMMWSPPDRNSRQTGETFVTTITD